MAVREKIFDVTEVTDVKDVTVEYDRKTRQGKIMFTAYVDNEVIREEVEIDGRIRSN